MKELSFDEINKVNGGFFVSPKNIEQVIANGAITGGLSLAVAIIVDSAYGDNGKIIPLVVSARQYFFDLAKIK